MQKNTYNNNLTSTPSVVQDRKSVLSPFYSHLSKMNILQDLAPHKVLLNDGLQTDQLHVHRLPSQLIQNVPLRFSSIQHYRQVWLKLFYQQAKCQIYRMKVDQAKQAEPLQVMQLKNYQNQSNNNDFKLFILQKLLPSNQQRSTFNIGSLVILSPVKPEPNQNYPHIIGFIQPFSGPNTVSQSLISVRTVFLQSIIRTRSQQQWQLMTTTKKWYMQEICSVNTLERQYYALMSLQKINSNLLQIFMRPQLHVMQAQKKFKIPIKLDNKLKNVYNQSQYKAINQCLRQTGVTLIQGPPGTGKTKTVLGTLSVLLSSYKKVQQQDQPALVLNWKKSSEVSRNSNKLLNPWLYTGYRDWRDQPYITEYDDPLNLTSCYLRCDATDRKIVLTKKDEGIQLPQKVLICGPSNASVDQIIRKLIKQQLYNKDGQLFLPSFVRIGQHYDQSLKQYALDKMAEKLAQKEHGTDISLYRSRILNQYRLVFSTLSAAGNQVMDSSNVKFDTVVIDEAGQSIQISNLIPLLYGCKRLILIGDPNQLPATVFSRKSIDHKYDQSLFERLMKSGYHVNVLKTQYRMHPEISQVIGLNFYGQKLSNWDKIIVQQPKATPCAFMIFHLDQSPQSSNKKSFRNLGQGKAVKDFALYLSKYYEDIGVVSPYSQQVAYIQSLIGPKNKKIQTKTIDSFQGRQKDVILFSSVRSRFVNRNKKIQENKRKTIGFVADLRRINVSLSRAKNLCVVFGDIKRLSINTIWKNIISYAIKNNQVYSYQSKKNFFQSFKQDPKKYIIKQIE